MLKKECMEKLSSRQIKTLEKYSSIIECTSPRDEREIFADYRAKLWGYLTCLADSEIITETEFELLFRWYSFVRFQMKDKI